MLHLAVKRVLSILNKVLAIDDDPVNRQLLEIYLLDNFRYKIANSADQALEFIGTEEFDVVVTDLNLGGNHDGIWLGKYIKSMPEFCHIPVVAFTSHSANYLESEKLNNTFDFVIEKPIIKQNFVARLKEILVETAN
jgi:CheY-like chemotaxis protein